LDTITIIICFKFYKVVWLQKTSCEMFQTKKPQKTKIISRGFLVCATKNEGVKGGSIPRSETQDI
jgi:hypothetical protein